MSETSPPLPTRSPEKPSIKKRVMATAVASAVTLLAACSSQPDVSVVPRPPIEGQRVPGIATPETQESIGAIKDRLISNKVLENWVNERPVSVGLSMFEQAGERKARSDIKQVMEDDINGSDVNQNRQSVVNGIVGDTIKRLSGDAILKENTLRVANNDSVTHELVTREIVHVPALDSTGDIYIARELKSDGSIISEAIVQPATGNTILTLQFTGEHYANANPDITQDGRFPRATATVFKLLVESLPKS